MSWSDGLTRTDWLKSLEPGDVVTLIVCIDGARLTAYRATIATNPLVEIAIDWSCA